MSFILLAMEKVETHNVEGRMEGESRCGHLVRFAVKSLGKAGVELNMDEEVEGSRNTK